MNSNIELIVGLGNPGQQYAATRHNAGAWFVERLAEQQNADLHEDGKLFGRLARIQLGNRSVRLLIPSTYMNESGKSVAAVAQFYKLAPESLLICHDELDIEPGTARFKYDGGHGGHNGLRDIISRLGNQKNFHRLRIGIGHPGNASQVSNFVLNKAPSKEQSQIEDCIEAALHQLPKAVSGDWSGAMNHLHSFKAD